MGILDRVYAIESRSNSGDDFWYAPIGAYTESKAGVRVGRETAMRVSAVYSCVRILAESIASLPVHLYKRLPGGGKERAVDHPMYDLVRRAPNPRMSAYQWMETMVYHMTLTGNAYNEKQTNNAQGVFAVYPWNPESVKIERTKKGDLQYELDEGDGSKRVRSAPQMVHVPGMAWDGISGMSPISYARESIGLSVATEEFGSRFFGNGTNMGTVYTLPEGARLTQEQTDNLVESLKAKHAGLSKSHSAILLPAGITASKVSIPPNDAQFLETRKFQVEEIARMYRIPLHMIQSETKSTSWGTGIESMSRGFVIYTLRPWLCRIEQVLNRSLLAESEQKEYFFEFLVDALLRGDQQARSEYFTAAIQNGWLNRNEVREIENRNPVDGGDEFLTPLNMGVAGENGQNLGDEPPTTEEKDCDCGHEHRAEPDPALDSPRMSIQRSYRRVIRDAMSRVIRRERNDIMAAIPKQMRKAAAKGETRATGSLEEFIAEFYSDHEEFTREAITPAFTALSEAIGSEAMREIEQAWEWSDELEEWLTQYIEAFANRHSNQSRGQLLIMLEELEADGVTTPDEVTTAFGERFENWELGIDGGLTRDDKIGARESVRLGNGFASAAFFAAGIATLVWRATGSETCPYCMSLNGRTVGRNDVFLAAGQAFQPNGASVPLNPISDVSHPPAHAGCDCQIVPG